MLGYVRNPLAVRRVARPLAQPVRMRWCIGWHTFVAYENSMVSFPGGWHFSNVGYDFMSYVILFYISWMGVCRTFFFIIFDRFFSSINLISNAVVVIALQLKTGWVFFYSIPFFWQMIDYAKKYMKGCFFFGSARKKRRKMGICKWFLCTIWIRRCNELVYVVIIHGNFFLQSKYLNRN